MFEQVYRQAVNNEIPNLNLLGAEVEIIEGKVEDVMLNNDNENEEDEEVLEESDFELEDKEAEDSDNQTIILSSDDDEEDKNSVNEIRDDDNDATREKINSGLVNNLTF